ncbi:MAG TPA: hypothetical protein VK176_14665 [Phycisphaerales bacterium]|nr:hypothetical protein [Phycisphaerales bacterium]
MSASRKPLSAERLVEVSDAVLRATSAALHGSDATGLSEHSGPAPESGGDSDHTPSHGSSMNAARPKGDAQRDPLESPAKGKREIVRPIIVHGCTAFEIEEACRFLVRLGVLESPPSRHAA